MSEQIVHSIQSTNLADILERVLDKGIVIAGDIQIKLADVELLTIKIRLLIASVDKAQQIGINWWETDSYLCSKAKETEAEKERDELKKKLEKLEAKVETSNSRAKLATRLAYAPAKRAGQAKSQPKGGPPRAEKSKIK